MGVVGLGGLGHMGVKFAHAFGARVVLFTTSASKTADALRLGAHEVVVSKNVPEMQKHASSFDFILDTVSAEHDLSTYVSLLKRDGTLTLVGAPPMPLPVSSFGLISGRANWPAPPSAAFAKPRRCWISAPSAASPPTSS